MFSFFTYANYGMMIYRDNFVSKALFVVTHHWMYSNLVPVKESRLYLTLENTTIKFTEMYHH